MTNKDQNLMLIHGCTCITDPLAIMPADDVLYDEKQAMGHINRLYGELQALAWPDQDQADQVLIPAVLTGAATALINRDEAGIGIPPNCALYTAGESQPHLIEVPDRFAGNQAPNLPDWMVQAIEHFCADHATFSYRCDPGSGFCTLVCWPDRAIRIVGRIEGHSYVRTSIKEIQVNG
jgi:hypothetical protein